MPNRTYMSENHFENMFAIYGSNASWIYVVVNASLRSYIIHHDQLGLSCPNHKREKYSQYNIYNVVNINKAIFEHGGMLFRSDPSWANMVVTTSWRTYVIRQSHSGLPY